MPRPPLQPLHNGVAVGVLHLAHLEAHLGVAGEFADGVPALRARPLRLCDLAVTLVLLVLLSLPDVVMMIMMCRSQALKWQLTIRSGAQSPWTWQWHRTSAVSRVRLSFSPVLSHMGASHKGLLHRLTFGMASHLCLTVQPLHQPSHLVTEVLRLQQSLHGHLPHDHPRLRRHLCHLYCGHRQQTAILLRLRHLQGILRLPLHMCLFQLDPLVVLRLHHLAPGPCPQLQHHVQPMLPRLIAALLAQ